MTEFYEPMLYICTPEYPNTMGALVTLKETVDGDILRGVVDELRVRFPYFYVKIEAGEHNLSPVPNPLPMIVRNTWDPIIFNSEESNYHVAAWKYEGNRLAFEISHSLTDGAGVLPYIRSTLYLYLSRKTGKEFDSTGFRLPGDVIPESETGNPFAGLDIDGAEAPLYSKETEKDFYRLNTGAGKERQITCIRLSEKQLMQYCRDFDGSPNTFFAVMFARAIRRFDPENEKTVSITVAIDHKAMLGNHDNYRMFANVVELDFPRSRPLDDLLKTCTMARGQLMLQAQPENSLWAMKQRKALYAKMDQVPLEMKLGMTARTAGSPRWSISISYANSRSFGPLDPYIDELYIVSEPGVSDIVCEITCINRNFFLAICQSFPADDFIRTFLGELSSVGIDCEVTGTEPLRLCGIKMYDRTGN
ncbi:MAG: hypothetical protein IJ088_09150 [Clostridia bacterium]|nr:hypothetical protein [Clostridia bacterium]